MHRLVDDQAPGLVGLPGGDRRQHETGRALELGRQVVLGDVADDRHPRAAVDPPADVLLQRAVADQAQLGVGVGHLVERGQEVVDALALLELADEEHHGPSVARRLHRLEAGRVHRLPGHEDLLAVDAGHLEQYALDVLAVDDDRGHVAVQRLGDRAAEAVKCGLRVKPHARPQHERHSAQACGAVQ